LCNGYIINTIDRVNLLKTRNFDLLLFSVIPQVINKAVTGGIRTVIVDLEKRGKQKRQKGYDTQINEHFLKDVRKVKENTSARVITRINPYWENTGNEINKAIEFGTDEILLPMVRSVAEVEQSFRLVADRCQLGILIETVDAVRISKELSGFPLARVYVGLNDLAIDRKISNIFLSVVDGTIDTIRGYFPQPFGFGGLTLPGYGSPVPSELLISESARLKTDFSFLRRSFYRDTAGKDISLAIPLLLKAISTAFQKSDQELEKDHQRLIGLLEQVSREEFNTPKMSPYMNESKS